MADRQLWPELPLDSWKETYQTLHMWAQIVGKIRLKLSPFVNHWWNSALYVTARGLTTSPIPYGQKVFEMKFDFIDHLLTVEVSDGQRSFLELRPRTVAEFYRETLSLLESMGLILRINPMPKEIPNPVPFDLDEVHGSYDRDAAHRFFLSLVQADRLLKEFRGGFTGKCSPVHFFWGSFDLAVTRFSGRKAPPRPEADLITQEAYCDEVISAGFWPGSGNIQGPAFYVYAAPEPMGFSASPVRPPQAFYNPPTRGFVLMYDEVRKSEDPDRQVLDFFQSTYDAAARLAKWDIERFALHRVHLGAGERKTG